MGLAVSVDPIDECLLQLLTMSTKDCLKVGKGISDLRRWEDVLPLDCSLLMTMFLLSGAFLVNK